MSRLFSPLNMNTSSQNDAIILRPESSMRGKAQCLTHLFGTGSTQELAYTSFLASSATRCTRPMHGRPGAVELRKGTFQSLASSESSFFDFRFSFLSFFFRFRSALSSAVSPSCLLRFFEVPSSFGGDTSGFSGALLLNPACAWSSFAGTGASSCLGG